MSVEIPRGEPRKDDQPSEIKLDVRFKPYKRVRNFYWPKKGEDPAIVDERYDHTLLLRRKVSLYGILGWIDIVSDDPESWVESLIRGLPIEKPFGETHFEEIYRGRDNIKYTKKPYILRFAFHLHNPAEYAKLLNTYADVNLGQERYMAAWNLSVPRVQRIMQCLEDGKEVILPEKNLINLKTENGNDGDIDGDGRNEDFGRASFVWLPEDLKKLRTIQLTFHRFFDKDDEEPPTEPPIPDRERLLVRT
ncbi:MAG: hypothetical protein PHV63_02190 [Candidatus Daviesbacteria bacterium]|nr:hypothetical protein [Candidatus Daviesbacteria bacterium]